MSSEEERLDVEKAIAKLNEALCLQQRAVLEHRLEHMIMRKQEAVDFLLRARGT